MSGKNKKLLSQFRKSGSDVTKFLQQHDPNHAKASVKKHQIGLNLMTSEI